MSLTMFSLCGTCRSEKIFVANRLRVHTALVLSATKIGTIPNPQKKLSRTISECISQSVNNIKQNKGAGKLQPRAQRIFTL